YVGAKPPRAKDDRFLRKRVFPELFQRRRLYASASMGLRLAKKRYCILARHVEWRKPVQWNGACFLSGFHIRSEAAVCDDDLFLRFGVNADRAGKRKKFYCVLKRYIGKSSVFQ